MEFISASLLFLNGSDEMLSVELDQLLGNVLRSALLLGFFHIEVVIWGNQFAHCAHLLVHEVSVNVSISIDEGDSVVVVFLWLAFG